MEKAFLPLIALIYLLFFTSCAKEGVRPESASPPPSPPAQAAPERERVCCPNEPFCGKETYGACKGDSDCMRGGCSGQVCQSQKEGPLVTTCEWRECYNAALYCMECRCVNNKCRWIRK